MTIFHFELYTVKINPFIDYILELVRQISFYPNNILASKSTSVHATYFVSVKAKSSIVEDLPQLPAFQTYFKIFAGETLSQITHVKCCSHNYFNCPGLRLVVLCTDDNV